VWRLRFPAVPIATSHRVEWRAGVAIADPVRNTAQQLPGNSARGITDKQVLCRDADATRNIQCLVEISCMGKIAKSKVQSALMRGPAQG